MDQTTVQTLLVMLKVDLGITTKAYDERLCQVLQQAEALIRREGASLDLRESWEDKALAVTYAAWLWRKRETMEGMPRMLRWAINNKIFGEAARE